MDRKSHLKKVKSKKKALGRLVIIGGGASGLGAAVDAASRGYRTPLARKKVTSPKAPHPGVPNLVHGGVRYLQNGDISLSD